MDGPEFKSLQDLVKFYQEYGMVYGENGNLEAFPRIDANNDRLKIIYVQSF